MKGLLITQCVQNDFVRPLAPDEPLPNLVHVGRLEAERLAGPRGALAPFLRAAHAAEGLRVVHVVDRHDPALHGAHLERFRSHCLAGSPGAELPESLGSLAAADPDARFVPAGDLNDFEDSSLRRTLDELGVTPDTPIGVVGVWTDAKVSYLLYDLATRFRARRLATCSGLTASRSLDAHFRALEQLQTVLGVKVFHSPGEFLGWLDPDAVVPAPPGERDALVEALAGPGARLQRLGGGYSGSEVLIARTDAGARVVKVGRRDETARERFGNERVGRVLGDVVPRLLQYREGAALAGMEVELARSGDPRDSTPATFQSLAQSDASESMTLLLDKALERAMEGALGRLYRVAEKDNADLLTEYGFTDAHGRVPFGASACRNAERVAAESGGDARVLLRFYREWLPGRTMMREVLSGPVHADFNLQNLLLSRREGEAAPSQVWLIDFARLARLPVLTDFAKVENDLSYLLLPAGPGAERLQEARLSGEGLELDLAPLASTPEERRHARWVGTLRRIAARMDPRPGALEAYRVALLRYAAHTLGFDEPTPGQRGLALKACTILAERLMAGGRTSGPDRLRAAPSPSPRDAWSPSR